ncbi:hypothetical protein B0H19DRAFT_1200436 [Mycena capillaripes]|nr:hypothetical protein B0H19DRAFT_1200436 [Mycena capillaripes]
MDSNSTAETCLVFGKNSMVATMIMLNGAPVYKVSTSQHGGTTEVRSSDTDALVARIARREILPDTVKFPDVKGTKSLRISKWLKRTALADGTIAFALQCADGPYFLRNHHVHRLALYGTDQTSIVAHWKSQTESSPLTLIISPGVERSHAQIIAAFLYAEQKMRSMEQTGRLGVQTLTAAQIAQSSTVVTGPGW